MTDEALRAELIMKGGLLGDLCRLQDAVVFARNQADEALTDYSEAKQRVIKSEIALDLKRQEIRELRSDDIETRTQRTLEGSDDD